MSGYQTIAEAMAQVGSVSPDRGFTFQDQRGVETLRTFPELEALTARYAAALQAAGLRKGDRMGLVAIDPEEFVLSFFAALRVGVVPVPLYPPLSLGSLDAYTERTARILDTCKARVLVASSALQNVLWSLVDAVPSLERLIKTDDLATGPSQPSYPAIVPEDVAFLQYTSGSTSEPKGVVVTHANLIANTRAIMDGVAVDPANGGKGVSWLPLYHDMGLIGCVITPVVYAIPMVFIPTIRFIKKPSCWFDTIHRHRATATFGPNFAYALMARRAKPEELERWDLSCVQVFGCGAEPIHPDTVREFVGTFGPRCGVSDTAFVPAYGMAEATLAVTFKPLAEPMRTRMVDADTFQAEGRAVDAIGSNPALEHVSCGRPMSGFDVEIRSEDGRVLPEGVEGEIVVRGPSVSPGYYLNEEATAAAFQNGWLRTGDLGYLYEGEVFVTGRLKDLIILNGRNIHPQSVEWACATVDGVRKGNVVAFSRPGAHSEELVVACESRAEDKLALAAAVKHAIQRELALTVTEVVCLEPGTLPKTSSGKLQRRKARQQYLAGALGTEGSRLPGATADRLTLARHVARSMWTRAKAAVWR